MEQMISSPQGMRVAPKMPAHLYTTFQVSSPISTHFKTVSCREVECQHNLRGWKTTIDTNTPTGMIQANYIRMKSGRHFTYSENAGLVVFTFPPGQKCFATHKVPVGRPELYVARGGDWRGNPRSEVKKYTRPEDFVDEFANHQDRLLTVFNQG